MAWLRGTCLGMATYQGVTVFSYVWFGLMCVKLKLNVVVSLKVSNKKPHSSIYIQQTCKLHPKLFSKKLFVSNKTLRVWKWAKRK